MAANGGVKQTTHVGVVHGEEAVDVVRAVEKVLGAADVAVALLTHGADEPDVAFGLNARLLEGADRLKKAAQAAAVVGDAGRPVAVAFAADLDRRSFGEHRVHVRADGEHRTVAPAGTAADHVADLVNVHVLEAERLHAAHDLGGADLFMKSRRRNLAELALHDHRGLGAIVEELHRLLDARLFKERPDGLEVLGKKRRQFGHDVHPHV